MSNNWRRFPNISFRRSQGPESSVSVNARLARLPSNDLADLAESYLGSAGRDLTHSRYTGKDVGNEQFYLDRAKKAAEQAFQALAILLERAGGPSASS